MRKTCIILLVLIIFAPVLFAQTEYNQDKIDPQLRSLIAEVKKNTANKKKCSKAEGKKSEEAQIKRYECIIYTKNASALKDKGIFLNSTLPTFATALVSLKQIEQLAGMAIVSYIELSKSTYPN
jgi:minor extracellular serine protease Vpr